MRPAALALILAALVMAALTGVWVQSGNQHPRSRNAETLRQIREQHVQYLR